VNNIKKERQIFLSFFFISLIFVVKYDIFGLILFLKGIDYEA